MKQLECNKKLETWTFLVTERHNTIIHPLLTEHQCNLVKPRVVTKPLTKGITVDAQTVKVELTWYNKPQKMECAYTGPDLGSSGAELEDSNISQTHL